MTNTIILKRGDEILTNSEYKNFSKGDSIYGDNRYPEEIKRWSIDQKEDAVKELSKYRCKYSDNGQIHYIEEYALEYCECDEEGEFVDGSDYDLASEAE